MSQLLNIYNLSKLPITVCNYHQPYVIDKYMFIIRIKALIIYDYQCYKYSTTINSI